MTINTLHTLLRTLEHEAQRILLHDGSFLEALHSLRQELDSNARVRAAINELHEQGLSLLNSFIPQIRIGLHAGENVVTLPLEDRVPRYPCSEHWSKDKNGLALGTQKLRDAASNVIRASLYRDELDKIVNEALNASTSFERLATRVERAGYEIHVCLDLSGYATVRDQISMHPPFRDCQRESEKKQQNSGLRTEEDSRLPLSQLDLEFLKNLRISP